MDIKGRRAEAPREGYRFFNANQMRMSVGLITRTSERKPIGVGDRFARMSLGGLYSAGCTLAGAPNLANMPGAVRYVQRGNP